MTFGASNKVGLNMPYSNLNLETIIQKSSLSYKQLRKQILAFTERLELESHIFSDVELIDRKSLFVVKVSTRSPLPLKKIEVAFRMYYLEDSTFSERLINSYARSFPLLKPVFFVLKNLIHRHRLDDQETGGISTFSLVLMIVAFFQQTAWKQGKPSDGLGPNLLSFLYFFGYLFDYESECLVPSLPEVAAAETVQRVL